MIKLINSYCRKRFGQRLIEWLYFLNHLVSLVILVGFRSETIKLLMSILACWAHLTLVI